CQQHSTYPPTF
nr:immunoglobulin light chain junction region [Macaca mulatta]